MKRLNMIIGKKQLVIASLAVVLGAAAAINIAVQTGKKDGVQPSQQVGGSSYGETALVSKDLTTGTASGSTDAYFASARLEKQQARDEAAQVLAVMYQGGDMTGGELETVAQNAKNLSATIESENAVETILKAQGFEDALCYISDKGANIIVKTSGLDAAGAAKIKSALLSEVEVSSDRITIVEVK
ncbi:MAG: SpoIIIAH-like family protein [Oscillospiraceae bacterium]|nr:SpoIIIAH-like family protein [Oscillospiraceae bacterium]